VASALSLFHRRLALIACLGLAIYLLGNSAISLWDRDEPRFAEAAREMMVTGDYVVPHFDGEIRFDKPPLIYWLMAGAYRVCGVGSFGARLPSALAGALSLVIIALIGRRLVDERAGLAAAVVLGLCLQFVVEAKVATTDALLLCTILAGELALLRSWQGAGGRANLLLGWGAVGLGILAKGPVAPVVVGVTAVALKLFSWRKWRWRPTGVIAGLAFTLVIVVPWAVAVQLATDGEFLRVALGHHVVERSTQAFEGHRGPIWYYLAALPVSFFPWGFLAYGVFWEWWRRRTEPAARFLVAWFALPFLIFSAAATKLPHYVLPTYPALALGLAWVATRPEGPPWWRPLGIVNGLAIIATLSIILILLAIGTHPVPFGQWLPIPNAIARIIAKVPSEVMNALTSPPLFLLALSFAAVGVAWLTTLARWHQAMVVAAVTAVTLASLGGLALPALEQFKPSPQMAAALASAAAPDRRYSFDYFEPSLVFHSGDTVTFIRDRDDLDILLASPAPFACVLRRDLWKEIAASFPAVHVVREIAGFNVAKGRFREWVVVAGQPGAAQGIGESPFIDGPEGGHRGWALRRFRSPLPQASSERATSVVTVNAVGLKRSSSPSPSAKATRHR
jgi:4-amino-4-deoxy-L-arabinose transferase-like glycosyltransferase